MSADLNTLPPPDPSIYAMGAIPKRSHNFNVQSPPAPPSPFLQGNLGALASPPIASSSFASPSQETTELLFSAPVPRKVEKDSPLTAVEKVTNFSKFISCPVGDNDGNHL